ncbi:hypothetical protein ABBQ32_011083 [Trebouxia sp. C0010 RCD-2024]
MITQMHLSSVDPAGARQAICWLAYSLQQRHLRQLLAKAHKVPCDSNAALRGSQVLQLGRLVQALQHGIYHIPNTRNNTNNKMNAQAQDLAQFVSSDHQTTNVCLEGSLESIVAGDLNSPPDSLEMHMFTALLPHLHDC